jgi:transcriptional regulator with XRE-family HTH domain
MSRLNFHKHLLECLGQCIRGRRQYLNMSQEDLAAESGVDRAFISRVEQGQRNPSMGAIASIAQALRLKFSRLMAKSEECMNENNH